ncbi:MAG: hypothetical protein M3P53_05320, partial [Actinomycetota bacterium]|nr:hypothetical protein [Actinomycetota bacterium]
QLGGFELRAEFDRGSGTVWLRLAGIEDEIGGRSDDLLKVEPSGVVQRLERRLRAIDDALTAAKSDRDTARREITQAKARLGSAFPCDGALRAAQRRQQEINERLLRTDQEPGPEPPLPERMAARLAHVNPNGPAALRV